MKVDTRSSIGRLVLVGLLTLAPLCASPHQSESHRTAACRER